MTAFLQMHGKGRRHPMNGKGAAAEFSAGGLISRGDKILLVKVSNLAREEVWTFPKGHLEEKETPLQAALREVEEETGWRCRSLRPLMTVSYRFSRSGRPVFKRVKWYWMKPMEKVGRPDAAEVKAVRWIAAPRAEEVLRYPSDFRLLRKWRQVAMASSPRLS